MRQAGVDDDQMARVTQVIDGCYVPWQENTFPGMLANVVAGRIANRLDLGGTNAVVDAACASSLAAISMAVNDLAIGNSDLVIAGGVDTLNDILMFMCFAKTGALSLSGDCRPFSDQADGTMLGEGVGMLALKRLADAERDGDAIYAVLRGLGLSDGRAKSIYAPSARGQTLALRRAYERAGYGPETVGLIEAHGTGMGGRRHGRVRSAEGSLRGRGYTDWPLCAGIGEGSDRPYKRSRRRCRDDQNRPGFAPQGVAAHRQGATPNPISA